MNRQQRRKQAALERKPDSRNSKPLGSLGNNRLFVKKTRQSRKVVAK